MHSIYKVVLTVTNMGASLPEVKDELGRVFQAIQRDRSLLIKYWKTEFRDQRITAENLEDLARNHLFDDHPELFGITEHEGRKIRSYFQEGVFYDFDFVLELHKEFPDVFEQERQEYLNPINKYRASKGLEPISL